MHTALSPEFENNEIAKEAQALISKCVHCGFCNATCPTYLLLGNELDGPRGRIYLMKEVFEGGPVTAITQQHLDRCLTCRACETTCPSGVQYSQLLDLGRRVVDSKVGRSFAEKTLRKGLVELVTKPTLFKQVHRIGKAVKPLLPAHLKAKIHTDHESTANTLPTTQHERKMVVLSGCVQPTLAPATNISAARVLDHLGISLLTVAEAGCCGAVRHHAGDKDGAKDNARNNIDAWWPLIQSQKIEAIVMTASGCGAEVQDYSRLLADDPAYAEKAVQISELCLDISVVVQQELIKTESLPQLKQPIKVAVQEPCTFQHALRKKASISHLLTQLGYETTPVADGHLCCGSAGTYSILQPTISQQLRTNKVNNLMAGTPALIATANVGCQSHLQETSPVPVQHWIELVDKVYSQSN